jgi:hypothetical protein
VSLDVARISKREHRAPSPPAKLYLLTLPFTCRRIPLSFSRLRPLARGNRYNMCAKLTVILLLKERERKIIRLAAVGIRSPC